MRAPSPPEAERQEPELTIFFDGACPLCRAEIGFWRGQPGADRIAFVDVARDGTALPTGVDRAQALARFHAETAKGHVISGAAAFLALMGTLPRLRWLARIGALPGIRQFLEMLYGVFLRLRPALVVAFVRLSGMKCR